MKPKHIAWTLGALGALALMAWFTLRFAAPNVIVAGQKATEKQAVHSLRTLLWAQDKFIERYGRAGTLAELAGRVPLDPPLNTPLLRSPLDVAIPLADGEAAGASGYLVRITPKGRDWVAVAWPEKRGESGAFAFCINGFEDIVQSPADAAGQGYDGVRRVPAGDACVTGPGPRLTPGTGADGGQWDHWRGRTTRRARASTP